MLMSDTYLVILASNVETRAAELDHAEQWAAVNNLPLNRRKCTEIVFVDPRRRLSAELPPFLARVERVTTMKLAPRGALPSLTTAGVSKNFLGAESELIFVELAGPLTGDDFFSRILHTENHVLHALLPRTKRPWLCTATPTP